FVQCSPVSRTRGQQSKPRPIQALSNGRTAQDWTGLIPRLRAFSTGDLARLREQMAVGYLVHCAPAFSMGTVAELHRCPPVQWAAALAAHRVRAGARFR